MLVQTLTALATIACVTAVQPVKYDSQWSARRPWSSYEYSHHNYSQHRDHGMKTFCLHTSHNSQHVDHIMRNPCHLYTSHNTTCLRLCVAADQALNHNDSTGIRNWTLYTN
ncbi:unnamed protein product [Leptidea sinapis]|uniref:Secreted protein n=1 Tax=Leptidea sinapis TaxID=189913 RepID=A0A5E4QQ71_9NEOP|nr:unnamed protein product [Leptidea sinapis]